jgi:hypothetical protein
VFDHQWRAVIGKAIRQLADDANPLLYLPQQQGATVRSNRPTIKTGRNLSPRQALEIKLRCATLCNHRAASLLMAKLFVEKQLMPLQISELK